MNHNLAYSFLFKQNELSNHWGVLEPFLELAMSGIIKSGKNNYGTEVDSKTRFNRNIYTWAVLHLLHMYTPCACTRAHTCMQAYNTYIYINACIFTRAHVNCRFKPIYACIYKNDEHYI